MIKILSGMFTVEELICDLVRLLPILLFFLLSQLLLEQAFKCLFKCNTLSRLSIHCYGLSFTLICGLFLITKGLSNNHTYGLFIAVYQNNATKVKTCIEKGLNVNRIDAAGRTPLHIASERSSSAIVELLLQSDNIYINKSDYLYDTPLILATLSNNLKKVQLLLDKGALVKCNDSKRSALHEALYYDVSDDIVITLLKKVDRVNDHMGCGTTLHRFIAEKRWHIAYALIEQGADIHVKDRHGKSLLDCALKQDNAKLIALLIEKEAQSIQ